MTIDTLLPTPELFPARRVLCIQPHYDVAAVWDTKIAAVRCYAAQFGPADLDELVMALDFTSRQVAAGKSFERGEPLKILHPSALQCGL